MLLLGLSLASDSTWCVIREVPESWFEKPFLDHRAASIAEEIPAKTRFSCRIDTNVVTPFHNNISAAACAFGRSLDREARFWMVSNVLPVHPLHMAVPCPSAQPPQHLRQHARKQVYNIVAAAEAERRAHFVTAWEDSLTGSCHRLFVPNPTASAPLTPQQRTFTPYAINDSSWWHIGCELPAASATKSCALQPPLPQLIQRTQFALISSQPSGSLCCYCDAFQQRSLLSSNTTTGPLLHASACVIDTVSSSWEPLPACLVCALVCTAHPTRTTTTHVPESLLHTTTFSSKPTNDTTSSPDLQSFTGIGSTYLTFTGVSSTGVVFMWISLPPAASSLPPFGFSSSKQSPVGCDESYSSSTECDSTTVIVHRRRLSRNRDPAAPGGDSFIIRALPFSWEGATFPSSPSSCGLGGELAIVWEGEMFPLASNASPAPRLLSHRSECSATHDAFDTISAYMLEAAQFLAATSMLVMGAAALKPSSAWSSARFSVEHRYCSVSQAAGARRLLQVLSLAGLLPGATAMPCATADKAAHAAMQPLIAMYGLATLTAVLAAVECASELVRCTIDVDERANANTSPSATAAPLLPPGLNITANMRQRTASRAASLSSPISSRPQLHQRELCAQSAELRWLSSSLSNLSVTSTPLPSQQATGSGRQTTRSRTYAERRARQLRAASAVPSRTWFAFFAAAHVYYVLRRRIKRVRTVRMRWYRFTLLSLPVCSRFIAALRAGRRLATVELLKLSPKPLLYDVGYDSAKQSFSFRDAHGTISQQHPAASRTSGRILAYHRDGTTTPPLSPPHGSSIVLCPEASGAWCYYDTASGISSWFPPAGSTALRPSSLVAAQLPPGLPPKLPDEMQLNALRFTGWTSLFRDATNEVLLMNMATGAMREAPWIALRTHAGAVYFANVVSRETRWLPPVNWMEEWICRRPCDADSFHASQHPCGMLRHDQAYDPRMPQVGMLGRQRVEGGAPYMHTSGRPQYLPDEYDTPLTYPLDGFVQVTDTRPGDIGSLTTSRWVPIDEHPLLAATSVLPDRVGYLDGRCAPYDAACSSAHAEACASGRVRSSSPPPQSSSSPPQPSSSPPQSSSPPPQSPLPPKLSSLPQLPLHAASLLSYAVDTCAVPQASMEEAMEQVAAGTHNICDVVAECLRLVSIRERAASIIARSWRLYAYEYKLSDATYEYFEELETEPEQPPFRFLLRNSSGEPLIRPSFDGSDPSVGPSSSSWSPNETIRFMHDSRQRTEVRTDYDGSSLPVGVTRTITKRRSKHSDTPYFCRLASGKRFYFATASEAASHYAAHALSSASPVAAPPSVSSSGVDLHLNPQSNTGYRCVHRDVRNSPSSRYVVRVGGQHFGAFADVEVAAEAYASLHASVAAHAPASRTALMRPWLLPTWPSGQEGGYSDDEDSDNSSDEDDESSDGGAYSQEGVQPGGCTTGQRSSTGAGAADSSGDSSGCVSSSSGCAATSSTAAASSASTISRDDSGHGPAVEILRVHGGTADMLNGWSCSRFSELHGHVGMFVSPSGSRFRRFSSVMANLGVSPLHHTVLTSGYAVTEHSSATNILLQQLTGKISSIAQIVRRAPPKNAPNDNSMFFTPIFQKAPTKFLNPNIGDGKRSSCFGLPVGHEAMWCQLGASVAMNISADIDLALAASESLSIIENSILRTEPGAANQIGHFDLQVMSPPAADSIPVAIIMLTPLDRNTSLRILPMGLLDHIPSISEFERLCVPVDVRVGQSLLMRYDMAHSGSSSPGLRLHSVLGPSSCTHHQLGTTFILGRGRS